MDTQINKNIGTRELTVRPNDPFAMSTTEFQKVQCYVEAAKRLPATKEDMQLKLGIAAEDAEQFDDLIAAYKNMVEHCTYFSDVTFPMSVGVAADIVHYSTKVELYYGAILTIVEQLEAGKINEEAAQAKLAAIVKVLRSAVVHYAENAQGVRAKMHTFIDETSQDESILQPIKERYVEKYRNEGGIIDTLLTQLEDAKKHLQEQQDEYQHDVTVSATTPTYAWIYPFGTVAAAIVAGIFGKKATDAQDRIHEYQNKISQETKAVRQALNLIHDLQLADESISGILGMLDRALPVLQKIEGVWLAIAQDLDDVLAVIHDQIETVPALISDLGVANAIEDWAQLADKAEAYRAHAFITVMSYDDVQKVDPAQFAVPDVAQETEMAVA